ncbi:hypothetical protein TNCV_2571051 [Trichonephila clavipes]|nr:hypothetical protein TNCV_2571051 [Trichonephila clavipes]
MSLCGEELYAGCTCSVKIGTVSAGCVCVDDAGVVIQRYSIRALLETAAAWHHWGRKRQWLGLSGIHATGHLARSCPSSNRFLTARCVTLIPTAARISTADAVRCGPSSFSVMPLGRSEPGLLVTTLDNSSQQSCTVDTFQVFPQHRGKKIHLLVALLLDLVQAR